MHAISYVYAAAIATCGQMDDGWTQYLHWLKLVWCGKVLVFVEEMKSLIVEKRVESTQKQINSRVKGTEKFWNDDSLEPVLQLVSDNLSDNFNPDAFWDRRKQRFNGYRERPPRRKTEKTKSDARARGVPQSYKMTAGKLGVDITASWILDSLS